MLRGLGERSPGWFASNVEFLERGSNVGFHRVTNEVGSARDGSSKQLMGRLALQRGAGASDEPSASQPGAEHIGAHGEVGSPRAEVVTVNSHEETLSGAWV